MSVYVIAELKFTQREIYDRYQARFAEVFQKFKGRLLVADERPQVLEGLFDRDQVVVLEFPDEAAAIEFQESVEYGKIAVEREAGADALVLMVRGRSNEARENIKARDVWAMTLGWH
ncbi:MAG: DUF1330 domain-containing protein [Hyphomicrobiales bacterium]|nr:DUF1330 domain-containing protein [Hyphomicrobiales bacterium]